MFGIEFDDEAVKDLRQLANHEVALIVAAIESQLVHEPDTPTKNRKLLRPNPHFQWELREQPFRVFYKVDRTSKSVRIHRVGRKDRNILYLRGNPFTLSES